MTLRSASLFVALATATTLAACGGGGGGSSSEPTAAPTATPGVVTVSPNPIVVSATAGNANHAIVVTITQTNAINGQYTNTSTCGTTGNGAISENNATTTYSSTTGLLTLTLTIAGTTAGTCTLTIIPPSGSSTAVPITVDP